MTSELKLLATIGVIALLAGCGGGSDGSVDVPDPGLPTDPGPAPIEITDPAAFPLSGNATYNGIINGDISGGSLDDRSLEGDLELAVAFNGANPGDVTGSARNFVDSTNVSYTGVLDVVGDFDPNRSDQLSAQMTGALSDGMTSFGVGLLLDGNFYGAEPDIVEGTAVGGGIGGGGFFTGGFTAER